MCPNGHVFIVMNYSIHRSSTKNWTPSDSIVHKIQDITLLPSTGRQNDFSLTERWTRVNAKNHWQLLHCGFRKFPICICVSDKRVGFSGINWKAFVLTISLLAYRALFNCDTMTMTRWKRLFGFCDMRNFGENFNLNGLHRVNCSFQFYNSKFSTKQKIGSLETPD